jgi:S-adenosyl-L-methionine hydrolase (adenosine-forming)
VATHSGRATFTPSGVITLTTDFGQEGPFVAVMKGAILARYREATLIDVTHEIPVHWPAEAGFWLARAHRYFPVGTVHVAVVDPGVGTSREILGVVSDGHVFLAPDNGLLAPVVGRDPAARTYRLDDACLERLSLTDASATFHGRDIFAPLAAEIAAGRLDPSAIGPGTRDQVPDWVDEPVSAHGTVTGVVITIDHFGNLITNIDASFLSAFADPQVRVGAHLLPMHRTYGDVQPGDYLALVNSFGVLEIARAEQSAAESLGLGRGAPVTLCERSSR